MEIVRPYKGQKYHELEICGLHRKLPIVQVRENFWIASNAGLVFGCDVEFTEKVSEELAPRIRGYGAECLLVPEAKGIPLAYETSKRLGHNSYAVARKSTKPYMRDYIMEELESITTKGIQKLVLDEINMERVKGKKICIIDDVITTGGSIRALEKLVERAGGKVVCKAVVWLEGQTGEEFKNEAGVIYLDHLPVWVRKEGGG